ncbi:YxcD family protein [Brevibacillus ginsengisoli]|uniref:YxcD family protein n=1 Tax=Brevibacillus ginsengisoli TaxID=363854 RepID=UPI003CEEA18B
METIKFSEQDLINAICIHVASKRQIQPDQVVVELVWDDDHGFSADIEVSQRQQILIEANLIEAVRFYLQTQLQRDPYAASIELKLEDEEGIIALASYTSY